MIGTLEVIMFTKAFLFCVIVSVSLGLLMSYLVPDIGGPPPPPPQKKDSK